VRHFVDAPRPSIDCVVAAQACVTSLRA